MKHDLKSWPEFFQPLLDGQKLFELRKDDRHFAVGDTLLIREYDDKRGVYTGREIRKRVGYILHGVGSGAITPLVGLSRGYVILSLETASEIERE